MTSRIALLPIAGSGVQAVLVFHFSTGDAHVLQLSLGKGSLSLLPVKIFDKPARLELANESIIDNRIDFDRFYFGIFLG